MNNSYLLAILVALTVSLFAQREEPGATTADSLLKNLPANESAETSPVSQDNTNTPPTVQSALDNVIISGQWFFSFDAEKEDKQTANEFRLKRGYVTLKSKLTDRLSVRITEDIAVDREGDGEGDIEIRLKYGYLQYQHHQLGLLAKPLVELGVVHRPWLDFEQKINVYRVQGSMFLERIGILRSADYGVTVQALLGGEVDKGFQKTVNKNYPGRYGSIALGLYNGGGYEALEENENKLVEGRLSLRPFPDAAPGLQLSWMTLYGKSNTAAAPQFTANAIMGSWEHRLLRASAIWYSGTGNSRGNAVDADGNPISQDAYSLFSEVRLPNAPVGLFARVDNLNNELNPESWLSRTYIAGIAVFFYKGSKIVLDYDYVDVNGSKARDSSIFEVALEFLY